VSGKSDHGFVVFARRVAFEVIATELGRDHVGLLDRIEIGVRPADVDAFAQDVHFFSHALGVVERIVMDRVNGA